MDIHPRPAATVAHRINPQPDPLPQRQRSTPCISAFAVCLLFMCTTYVFLSVILSFSFSAYYHLVIREHVPEFGIESTLVSNFSLSSEQITGDFQFEFVIRNPNKKLKVYYEQVVTSLYYKRVFLAERIMEPFNQGTKEENKVRSSFVVNGYCADCKPAGNSTSGDETGLVELELRILCWASVDARFWQGRRTYWVLCENVKVGSRDGSNLGILSGGEEKCKVILM